MSRLIGSENALRTLVLLSQRSGGLRTSEIADALAISYTGAGKGIEILLADGLVTASGRRYAFALSPRAQEAVRFAFAFLCVDVVLGALAAGNESVEFAGADDGRVMIVFRRFAEPVSESRMREAVETLRAFAPETQIEFMHKEGLRDRLLTDLTPRRRASSMRVLAGSVDVTFPDKTRHGDIEALSLGRLNDAVMVPSGRRLRALARDHGLRRIVAFGSATRADFRPDSDIDLLVEPAPGHHLGLDARVSLMADADRLFDRDVDLVMAPVRRQSLAQRISREGVVLFDAAR